MKKDLTIFLGDDVYKMLKAVEAVWILCCAKTLNEDYQEIIDEYERCLRRLFERIRMPCPPKSHIVIHHFKEYFSLHKRTMWLTSDEPRETNHSYLRKFEEKHGFHITERLYGTLIHKKRALNSILPQQD